MYIRIKQQFSIFVQQEHNLVRCCYNKINKLFIKPAIKGIYLFSQNLIPVADI